MFYFDYQVQCSDVINTKDPPSDYQVQCSDVINTEDPPSGNCKPQSILIKGGGNNPMALIPLASGTLSHWLMPYKEERGKVYFQCGTLKLKKDYKCNTWSLRQKLLLQY